MVTNTNPALIKLCKKNAPIIYELIKTKRIQDLNSKIQDLLLKVKNAQDVMEKSRIQGEIYMIKNYLKVFD